MWRIVTVFESEISLGTKILKNVQEQDKLGFQNHGVKRIFTGLENMWQD